MLNSKCHFIEEKQENIKKFVQPVQRFLIIEVCDACPAGRQRCLIALP